MAALTLVIGNKSYSSWSMRAWLTLRHFGIEFEEVLIPLDQEDSQARKLEYSPAGRVPILIDGETRVWDSLAIVEYVADAFPEKAIWPADREARARARSIAAEMHSSFDALRDQLPFDTRSRHPARDLDPEVAKDLARVREIWRECRERHGAGGEFLFGEFGGADAMFAPVVSRLQTYAVPLDGVEAAYAEAVLALPATEQWMSEAREEPWTLEL